MTTKTGGPPEPRAADLARGAPALAGGGGAATGLGRAGLALPERGKHPARPQQRGKGLQAGEAPRIPGLRPAPHVREPAALRRRPPSSTSASRWGTRAPPRPCGSMLGDADDVSPATGTARESWASWACSPPLKALLPIPLRRVQFRAGLNKVKSRR